MPGVDEVKRFDTPPHHSALTGQDAFGESSDEQGSVFAPGSPGEDEEAVRFDR